MLEAKSYKTKSLYFSDRLNFSLQGMLDHPLTVVEAPMGYGKTTAVKEHLKKSEVKVLWQTVYNSSASNFWGGFSKLFAEIDSSAVLGLMQLGIPNDSVSRQAALNLVKELKLPSKTVIVLDDYHYIEQDDIHNFIDFLVRNKIPNLHIVIIARLVVLDNLDELKLKGYAHHISQEIFELTPNEISRYFRLCGINLQAEELNTLYAYTEGWISALYLCMLNFISEGRFEQEPSDTRVSLVPNIYKLLEQAVYLPLSEETKEFLLRICIFDKFTFEQAEHMWQKPNATERLEELVNRNAFISYDTKSHSYQMHHILSNFLRDKLSRQDEISRQELYQRAAQWYVQNGDNLLAMHYFYKADDFDQVLATVELDKANSLNNEHKDMLIKYFTESPVQSRQNYPYAMLIYARRLLTFNERELFTRVCSEFMDSIQSNDSLGLDQKKRLLGEYELLLSFTGYNDIMEMSKHHRKACELLTGPSDFIDNQGSWTFGSPSVLFMFYRETGKLGKAVQVIKETMPYYYQLTNGHGSGAEYVMAAEWYFNTGEFENAELTAHKALFEATSYVQSGIMLSALFLQIRLAIIKNDYSNVLSLFQKMREEINQKKLYMFMHSFDLCKAFIYSGLKQKEPVPLWIARGEFQNTRLLFPAMPFINIVYGRVLLINGEHLKLIGTSEHLLGMASVFPNLLAKIYTYIYMGAAYEQVFRHDEAIAVLKQALDIALPDQVYMPFVENCDYIKTLLEQFGRDNQYRDDISRILKLYNRYENSVTQIIQTHFDEDKPQLTQRELEIAKLAVTGLTNQEIAASLFISTNTVKTQLKSIFAKLGVNSRSLLKQYIE